MSQSIRLTVFCCLFGAVGVGALSPRQSVAAEFAIDGVCLYVAMDAKRDEVRFIAVNGSRSNLATTNLTDEAIEICIPNVVIAAPIAKANQASSNAKCVHRDSAKFESQAVGGAIVTNVNRSRSVDDGRSALLTLAPKKTRRLKARTVGLEFGKAVPNARVAYELVRPESKVDDARLMELFRQLGNNQVHPFIGQAIAWHLTDDLSWNDLSHGGSNSRTISNYLTSSKDHECGFCPMTLNAANKWVSQNDSLASSDSGASSDSENE